MLPMGVHKALWAETARLLAFWLLALLVAVSIGVLLAANPAHAATFTVNLTADTPDANLSNAACDVNPAAAGNQCTLRAAIQEANDNNNPTESDRINFNISGPGVKTISPTSILPFITEPVIINGYSQPGASPNTLAVGDNAVLKIKLDGANIRDANGLQIFDSSGSVIRGFVILRFSTGIDITGNSVGNRIEGNFIGTDSSGTLDRGNASSAVEIAGDPVGGPSKTVVGGSTPDKRNVLSGNDLGVTIINANANRIQGNYIGTDKSGTKDLGNQHHGVAILGASGTTIGGKTAASRNVISGNNFHGIDMTGSSGRTTKRTRVLGNRIGTTASGKVALGNDFKGVLIEGSSSNTLVGDGTSAGANTIAFNGLDGVDITDTSSANKVLRNSIFSNGGLGLDLRGPGESFFTDVSTPNDSGDGDAGPNDLQNFPLITSAKTMSGKTTINGQLNSRPAELYTIQFFSNPSGNEGKTFIGSKSVSTDGAGDASFSFSPTQAVAVGQTITATATRDNTGDTSEFSAPRTVTSS